MCHPLVLIHQQEPLLHSIVSMSPEGFHSNLQMLCQFLLKRHPCLPDLFGGMTPLSFEIHRIVMLLDPCTSFSAIVFCLHSFLSFIRHPVWLRFLRHIRVRLRNVSLYGVSYFIAYAYSKHLLETFFAACLVPTITRPTRITSESATLIDTIYVSGNRLEHLRSGILLAEYF